MRAYMKTELAAARVNREKVEASALRVLKEQILYYNITVVIYGFVPHIQTVILRQLIEIHNFCGCYYWHWFHWQIITAISSQSFC